MNVPTSLTGDQVLYLRRYLNDPEGNNVQVASTSTPPDGARTYFVFAATPIWCSFNKVNQFANLDYTVAVVSGEVRVTFKDSAGGTITPIATDDIKGFLAS